MPHNVEAILYCFLVSFPSLIAIVFIAAVRNAACIVESVWLRVIILRVLVLQYRDILVAASEVFVLCSSHKRQAFVNGIKVCLNRQLFTFLVIR